MAGLSAASQSRVTDAPVRHATAVAFCPGQWRRTHVPMTVGATSLTATAGSPGYGISAPRSRYLYRPGIESRTHRGRTEQRVPAARAQARDGRVPRTHRENEWIAQFSSRRARRPAAIFPQETLQDAPNRPPRLGGGEPCASQGRVGSRHNSGPKSTERLVRVDGLACLVKRREPSDGFNPIIHIVRHGMPDDFGDWRTAGEREPPDPLSESVIEINRETDACHGVTFHFRTPGVNPGGIRKEAPGHLWRHAGRKPR